MHSESPLFSLNYLSLNLDSEFHCTLSRPIVRQKNVGIFHWKWCLLLLIRALYGWVRCVTPKESQIFTVQDLHTITAMVMGVYCAGKYSSTLPGSIKSTYQACIGYDQSKWIHFFMSNSKSLPCCTSTESFHEVIDGYREPNCFKAFWKDSVRVICPHSFKFFMKLHFIAALLGGAKFVKDVRSMPLTVGYRITRNALKSTLYWALGVHAAIRYLTEFVISMNIFNDILCEFESFHHFGVSVYTPS